MTQTKIEKNEMKAESFGIGSSIYDLAGAKTKAVQDKMIETAGTTGSSLEANLWLPFAASKYKLSKDIRDYILIPVPVLINDLPNTNGDSAGLEELLDFKPDLGMQAYKTFRGKPTFVEHDNRDYTKAKGVILDSFLRPLRKFGNGKYYKMVLLLAYDRTKDPLLVNSILTRENNAYSLGFYFKSYVCSICGNKYGEGGLSTPCTHTMPKRPTYRQQDGRLAYRRCEDIRGFETSSVKVPAYAVAVQDYVIDASSF